MENKNLTFANLALALANDYSSLYVIDSQDDSYAEYAVSGNEKELLLVSKGENFFKDVHKNCMEQVWEDDQEYFLNTFRKENVQQALKNQKSFSLTYRLKINGEPKYFFLKTIQAHDRSIVIGVQNVDEQKRKELETESEKRTYSEIAEALASRYEVIYYVNTDTDEYTQYSASERYTKLGMTNQGTDFFTAASQDIEKYIHPEDKENILTQMKYHVNIITNEYSEYSTSSKYSKLEHGMRGKDFFAETQINLKRDIYPEDQPMVSLALQKENLLNSLSAFGKTILNYRLMLDGRAQYVSLYAVRPKEDSEHIIVAVANVDKAKRMELAYHDAVDMANRDVMTGVKNKRAYVQMEIELDEQIKNNENQPFAVVVCDVNGLKQVNDTQGHKAGDEFIRKACSVICNTFKHSPVFRIGGDEFAVILKNQDYQNRTELMHQLGTVLNEQKQNQILLLASGLSEFEPEKDMRVQDVFERADSLMYLNKKHCKEKAGI